MHTHAYVYIHAGTHLLHGGAVEHVKLVGILMPEPADVVRRRSDESLDEAVHVELSGALRVVLPEHVVNVLEVSAGDFQQRKQAVSLKLPLEYLSLSHPFVCLFVFNE